jgi:hypothetical protein
MRTNTTTPTQLDTALAAAATRRPQAAVSDDLTIYTIDEVAAILRQSAYTIRRRMAAGTFRPAPIDRRPFRWLKADLVAELERLRSAAEVAARSPRRRRRKRTRSN